MKCSVVMVSFHTGPVLLASVTRVLAQPGLGELIVVNNGNPPDMISRLQQWALQEPRFRFVSGHGNIGFAAGCNLGAKSATGDFILLLNPDCLLPPDALTDAMAAFDDAPGAMLAGPLLLNPDGSQQRGGRRQLLTPAVALSEALGLYRVFGLKRLNEHEAPMPPYTHETPAVSGAFMCMRRSAYDALGGMDEGYFLHVEDLDLCMRVRKAGGKVICAPGIKVAHLLSTSGQTASRFIEWHKAKGFMRYFRIHFADEAPPGLLLLLNACILVRFALRTARAVLRAKYGWKMQATDRSARQLMLLAMGPAELPQTADMAAKTVLVTGATGQVGLCVIRRLLARGASVLALSRGPGVAYFHERLHWVRGDLRDANLHLHGYLADAAIHCAPLWTLPQAMKLLAESEVRRVVAFGSTSIFGKADSHDAYEKALVETLRRSEAELTRQCDSAGVAWTLLRPTLVYGVGLDGNVAALARLIGCLGFCAIYPPAKGRRQPVHAEDLAIAALTALQRPVSHGRSYNLSGGEILTYREMLERIFKACGKPVRLVPLACLPLLLGMAGRLLRKQRLNGEIARRMNEDLVFFHDDARRELGYHPRAFLPGGIDDIEGG